MPANTAKELHTPVSGLIAWHQKLVAGLGTAGLSAAELTEVLARSVRADCVKCGISVSGTELADAALAGPAPEGADSKLSRLRQGYCGRNGCDSNYYNVRLGAHPTLDWDRVLLGPLVEETPAAEPEPPTEEELAATAAVQAARRRRWIRVAIGLAALAVLLIARYVMNGGRIPLLHPRHEYRTAPPVHVE